MDEVLAVVIRILTITGALAATIFVIVYTRSPWRKNVTGRNTMAFMAVVAAALITAVVFRLSGHTLPLWLSAIIWVMINWPMWWRVVILWRAQHQKYVPPPLPPHVCTHCGNVCGAA